MARFPSILVAVTLPFLCVGGNPQPRPHSVKTCKDLTIRVVVSFNNFVIDTLPFENNFDATEFTTAVSARTSATGPFDPIVGFKNFTDQSYDIAATFCRPTESCEHEKTVLLATHGFGFDRRYSSSLLLNYGHADLRAKLLGFEDSA
jgi:hypothetical protein